MQMQRIENMKGGWFVGNFEPSAFKSDQFEVCYKVHPRGERWEAHYHEKATEINYLIRGQMRIQGRLLFAGDIFTIAPYEVANPEFIDDCELIVVKVPCVKGDKVVVNN